MDNIQKIDWEDQLRILLYSKNFNKFYEGSLTNNDITSNIPDLDIRIDASKLFNYKIKLHDLYAETEEKYVIATQDDYGVCYGGDKLSVNFIYIGLNQLYSRIENNDILLSKIGYKHLKLFILRILWHLRNMRFAKNRVIRYNVYDILSEQVEELKDLKIMIANSFEFTKS
mgnify:CR=1 FL=1